MNTPYHFHGLKRVFCILILCALLVGFNPGSGFAASSAQVQPNPPELQADLSPLADYLAPDGSLDLGSGFTGSLDPRGFRMAYAPDGAPIFAPLDQDLIQAPATAENSWNALGSGANGIVECHRRRWQGCVYRRRFHQCWRSCQYPDTSLTGMVYFGALWAAV